MNLNKVQVIGHVTKDPELKALPSGTKVVSFSLGTNRTWKDKDGAKQESAEFVNFVGFAKQAEVIAQWVKKGSLLYAEGRLQTRTWDGKDGKKNYRTEVVLERFEFGPKAAGSGAAPKAEAKGEDDELAGYGEPAGSTAAAAQPAEGDINPDDIPF